MGMIPKVTVLGLGGAGIKIINRLSSMSASRAMRLIAIDTDMESLAACPLPEENKLLAAEGWRNGRGCGGNALTGHSSIARERNSIRELIGEPEMLLVIGGLGGGTCTGGLSVVLSEARRKDFPAIFLLTLPFTMEGHSKRKLAEETLQGEILPIADVVLCVPNDLLFEQLPPDTPFAEACAMSDTETARTAVALSAVLRYGNLLSASFSDLAALLKHRKSFCSIGVGTASGEGRAGKALEQMLLSPLCGGMEKIKKADAAVFSLLGGPDLSMGEVRQTLEYAGSMVREDCTALISTGNMSEMGDEVHLCGIFIKFDSGVMNVRPDRESAPAARRSSRKTKISAGDEDHEGDGKQLSLQFEIYSKGEMEGTMQVVYRGEDLDVPTFLRRKISVASGDV